MKINNKDTFFVEKVNQQELFAVLLDHFESAQHNIQCIRFQKKEYTYFLDVRLNKKNQAVDIVNSKDFPKVELINLKNKIKETLVENQILQFAQVICFTPSKKIEGYYRYKDLFQLLPMPKEYPQTPMRSADHPCLLQFSFTSCPDPSICFKRIDEKSQQYLRILNVLLKDRIFAKFTRGIRDNWIQDDKSTVKWGGVGYQTRDGFTVNMKNFSATNNLKPIKTIPAQEYYSNNIQQSLLHGRGSVFDRSVSLVLPDSISNSLDTALNLPEEEFNKFLNACAWYDRIEEFWNISHSSAFISSVIAIECLRDKSKDEHCGECKQIKNITKNFKEFLSEYVPFIDQVPQVKKAIYDIRSKLAHGVNLLSQDIEPWNNTINPKAMSEARVEQALLFIITVTVLRNWLWKRKIENNGTN